MRLVSTFVYKRCNNSQRMLNRPSCLVDCRSVPILFLVHALYRNMQHNPPSSSFTNNMKSARLQGLAGMAIVLVLTKLTLDFGVLHRRSLILALLYVSFIVLPSFVIPTERSFRIWAFLCRYSLLIGFLILYVLACF